MGEVKNLEKNDFSGKNQIRGGFAGDRRRCFLLSAVESFCKTNSSKLN